MTEIWRPIKGYESRYEVSNLGNVRNVRYNNRPLSPFLNSNGYYLVSLSKNGRVTKVLVHRLVANAFIDNLHELPCVNHKDECTTNNTVSNLEWCDKEYNNRYGSHPSKIADANSKSVYQMRNGEVIQTWKSCSEAARVEGFSISCIVRCCNGERKQHKGYEWQYAI